MALGIGYDWSFFVFVSSAFSKFTLKQISKYLWNRLWNTLVILRSTPSNEVRSHLQPTLELTMISFFSSKRASGSQSGKNDLDNESQESRPCVLCIYTYQLLIQHGMRITYWYVFDCRIDILEHDGFTVIAHSLTAHIGKLWPKELPIDQKSFGILIT